MAIPKSQLNKVLATFKLLNGQQITVLNEGGVKKPLGKIAVLLMLQSLIAKELYDMLVEHKAT